MRACSAIERARRDMVRACRAVPHACRALCACRGVLPVYGSMLYACERCACVKRLSGRSHRRVTCV